MIEIVCIELVDLCYYDDDFKYPLIYVIKDKKFEKKCRELENVCKNYEDFEEVYEFINKNFITIELEKREFEV